MQDPDANFFETQQAFELYWENREITKGCGFKPFKRWESYMAPRVDAFGNKPRPGEIFRKSQAYFKNVNARSTAGNWKELGPVFNDYTTIEDIRGLGRINTVAFHPSDAVKMWVGTPQGGLWYSPDYGESWQPMTDDLPTLGVSAIVMDHSDANIMYMGTGDRDANDAPGMGVWKSNDGGVSWDTSFNGMGLATVGAQR